jgi:hypothetical protein
MKRKILLWFILMSGVLAIPNAGLAADGFSIRDWWNDLWGSVNGSDANQLQGRWYLDGDPNKPTEIIIKGSQLEARNETGQASKLETDRTGTIHAPDWQGVHGRVRGSRIEWSNGTTWTRQPAERIGGSTDRRLRNLEGRWYVNDDPNKPAEIYAKANGLEAKNENGQTTRLDIDRDGDLVASDWQNIRGDVRGGRIDWSNGTTWRKLP